jgi:hypothetical protein
MKERIAELMRERGFLVFLTDENSYEKHMLDIVSSAESVHSRICYVCLSSTYQDVVEWMNLDGIDSKKFCFVDTLSSHYEERKSSDTCLFIPSPSSLEGIKQAISASVMEKGCTMVIFDTISGLLQYEDMFSILKFTHSIMAENSYSKASKMYVVIRGGIVPEEESRRLVADLEMMADEIVDLLRNGSG